MTWSLRRAAALAVVAAATAAFAPATVAQTGTDAPTASPAPDSDAAETTGPRRRPAPRSARTARRTRPEPRRARRDTLTVPFVPASERTTAAEATAAWTSRLDTSLREAAPRWLGIPYRWGGTTRRGIDCSSFVQQYVRETLAIELPRTTATQQYEGVPIDRAELRAGDLVFFRRRGVRHVGVYLSAGEFIHASSSQGVTVSDLTRGYWDRHYWMSRRIHDQPSGRTPTPRSERRVRG